KGFTLFDGADFDPQFGDYSTSDGSGFLFTRKGVKKIPLPFYNKTGTFEEYDELQKALNTEEPKELKFSRAPEKVFYAIPTGTMSFEALVR
ncbi:phage tail family protein, partial [Streptococcus anginosus]